MADCDYSPVPVPADLRGPTGEEAQILIDGIARRIALFMGKRDWELDWHIYLDLRNQVERPATHGQAARLRGSVADEHDLERCRVRRGSLRSRLVDDPASA